MSDQVTDLHLPDGSCCKEPIELQALLDSFDEGTATPRVWSLDKAINNRTRAARAAMCLSLYVSLTQMEDEDIETVLADLVADLMHLADAGNVDWVDVDRRATVHHDEEAGY